MTDEEIKLALYCLKASSDYHSEVCEECIKYPNCDHTEQDDVTEIIIQALEQEPIIDKIRDEIADLDDYDYDCEEYYKAVEDALRIVDKYRTESEDNE